MTNLIIIGGGQMGTSVALSAFKADYNVSVYDVDPDVRDELSRLIRKEKADGISVITDLEASVKNIGADDIVVLATPIDKFADIVEKISDIMPDGAILTDVGSGKVKSIAAITNAMSDNSFSYVPSHPLVGRAGKGPETAVDDMFEEQAIVVVPENTDDDARKHVEKFWNDLGGRVNNMSAETHDSILGMTSHLEHVIAFALTRTGRDKSNADASIADADYKNAGNFLRDTTRIANANADMWIPIFKDNKEAILAAAGGFKTRLLSLDNALSSEEEKSLHELLGQAHDFAAPLHEERPGEMPQSEYDDFAGEKQGQNKGVLTTCFNNQSFARSCCVPAVIGVAITLNARETEDNLKFPIADIANPSFLDGTRPAAASVSWLSQVLRYNKAHTSSGIGRFLEEFDEIVEAIENEDSDFIADLIGDVRDIRATMPEARGSNIRPEYARGS